MAYCLSLNGMRNISQSSMMNVEPIVPQSMQISHIVLTSVTSKEGNILFNDVFNTFYFRLYGVQHMVKDHSDSER